MFTFSGTHVGAPVGVRGHCVQVNEFRRNCVYTSLLALVTSLVIFLELGLGSFLLEDPSSGLFPMLV